jgi:hypothetical protein
MAVHALHSVKFTCLFTLARGSVPCWQLCDLHMDSVSIVLRMKRSTALVLKLLLSTHEL